jgi:hypothetical protein
MNVEINVVASLTRGKESLIHDVWIPETVWTLEIGEGSLAATRKLTVSYRPVSIPNEISRLVDTGNEYRVLFGKRQAQ